MVAFSWKNVDLSFQMVFPGHAFMWLGWAVGIRDTLDAV